ncbi:MAG: membrane protease subunit, stomatin/prohibitin [Desulfurococcales archaeon ex4484_58]|nr:MAG: membrane protease subunit, stomatin/prohibitin [Desulfurococcales archaeon ex4484_58]
MLDPATLFLLFLLTIIVIYVIARGIIVVRPWAVGIYIRLGKFVGILKPGVHWVPPFISRVYSMDLRTQVVDVPRQDVITRDNSPVSVDAIVYFRVVDPQKAFFEVTDYRAAIIALAQTTLRSVIGDMELDEILYNRAALNTKLRKILDEATDKWGVRVETVEIREVEPSARVKKAMEEQTSAERERRAAILRADGERRAAILRAEGDKTAAILRAEGERMANILRAEGERLATILKAQGEAQRLRILSLGAASLHSHALSAMSLETLRAMANGQATKIIVPYEISRLIEGIASYLTKGVREPQVPEVDVEKLVKLIGKPEEILGKIPSYEELSTEVRKAIEEAKKRKISPTELTREEKELLESARE